MIAWPPLSLEKMPLDVWLAVAVVAFGYLGFIADPWSIQRLGDWLVALMALSLGVRSALKKLTQRREPDA